MWTFGLLWSCICIAVGGALNIIFGYRGERLDIKCSYEPQYKRNLKYFCKGECTFVNKIIMVQSGSPAEDERFSLTDNTTARVFTVSITDLRTADEGQYWCAVERTLTADVYSEVLLEVKEAPQSALPTVTGSLIAGVLVLLLGAVLVIVAVRKKKLPCGPARSAEEPDLTSRRGEENEYEQGNPMVLNAHAAQSENCSSVNQINRPANTQTANTDPAGMNASATVTNTLNLDQIYTELNASRQSHFYHCLTTEEESLYQNI